MKASEADVVLALLRHLDGSQVLDEQDFLPDLLALYADAACDVVGAPPLNEETLLDTLAEVAQRHADAANYAQDWADVS